MKGLGIRRFCGRVLRRVGRVLVGWGDRWAPPLPAPTPGPAGPGPGEAPAASPYARLVERAEARRALGEFREAARDLTWAYQLQPGRYWTCDRLAEVFRDGIGDLDQAIAWFSRSHELHPIPWPLDRIAELVRDRRGDPAGAVAWFEKAVACDPANYWSCDRLAELYRDRLDRPEEALAWFARSAERHPIPWVYDRMAELCRDRLGDPVRAAAWFEKAVGADPANAWSCDRLGELYHDHLRDDGRALEWFRESARRKPSSWVWSRIAGIQRDHLGDLGAALDSYREAAALDPADALSRQALGDLFALAHGDGERAQAWRNEAREIDRARRRGEPPPGEGEARPPAPLDWLSSRPDRSLATGGPSEARRSGRRCILLTIPKAGTYLLAQLLENLGLVNLRLHIGHSHLWDDRFLPVSMTRQYQAFGARPFGLRHLAKHVQPSQFVYGHVTRIPKNERILDGWGRILAKRNLRDVLVSLYRQQVELRRDVDRSTMDTLVQSKGPVGLHRMLDLKGHAEIRTFSKVADWRHDPATLVVSYERLVGDEGRDAQVELVGRIGTHLELEPGTYDPARAIDASLGSETATRSSRRSRWQEYWDDRVEEVFVGQGFAALNRELGYE